MAATTLDWRPAVPSLEVLQLDPASRVTHGCQTIVLLLFTILWNSVVWPMVFICAMSGWRAFGFGVWAFGLFLLPFVVIGLWLIWQTVSSFITQWYPVPSVELDRMVRAQGGIRAGSTFPVRWTFAERAGLFRSLTASVMGFEEVQVRRGTDTVTERSVFHRSVLFEGGEGIQQGMVTVSIPPDAAPSFQALYSRIAWMVRMEAVPRVRFWPMMVREFAMVVEGKSKL